MEEQKPIGGIEQLLAEFTIAGHEGQRVLEAYLRLAGWTPDMEPTEQDLGAIAALELMLKQTEGYPSDYRLRGLSKQLSGVIPTERKAAEEKNHGEISDDNAIADMILEGIEPAEIVRIMHRFRQQKYRKARFLIEDVSAVFDGQVGSRSVKRQSRGPGNRRVKF